MASAIAALARGRARPRVGRVVLAAIVAIVTLLFTSLTSTNALAAFTPPPLVGHVVDTSGKLTRDDVHYLDLKLDAIRQQTGFEIVALVVGSLEGEAIEDVAYKAFNTWGIGRKGKDNGVLLVIAPNDGTRRIETGKGVGGALTDLQANDILRGVVAPLVKQGKLRDAVDRGAQAIAETLVAGTPEGERKGPIPRTAPEEEPMSPMTIIAAGVGLVVVIVLAIVSPAFRSILWAVLQLAFFFVGRGGRGGGGGGGSGYSGGGGRSGGGGSSDSS